VRVTGASVPAQDWRRAMQQLAQPARPLPRRWWRNRTVNLTRRRGRERCKGRDGCVLSAR
jgi:hypothetical protein